MIIIDKKLEELKRAHNPIRVGLVGAGFAAKGFALQLLTHDLGMKLVAISNRTVSRAREAYQESGVTKYEQVKSQKEFDQVQKENKYVVTDDPELICQSSHIDVVVEATGEVEFGAKVALSAIENKKHLVLINAELDATLGPILKIYADRAGVVYTQADGDQPAVMMNLFRYVKFLGFKQVMCGNIKSLIDVRRTPATQKKFAETHFQRTKMITSFADGTKISFENASLANGTGFPVLKRGMLGPRCSRVEESITVFKDHLSPMSGFNDYILGAEPSFGVFVIGYSADKVKQKYMWVYKMGDGPFYVFYVPYHLSPLEAPLSVARAFLFHDAALAPIGKPVCDVITLGKRDLKKGEILDGIGGFTCYGVIENYEVIRRENLLPMGLSDGCRLKKNIKMDEVLTNDDVEFPKNRLCDRLRREQDKMFL